MKVLRVEKADGGGPCANRPAFTTLTMQFYAMPVPVDDGIQLNTAYVCGIKDDMNLLLEWFEDSLKRLAEWEYYISEYEVPEDAVQVGRKQVMFFRQQAKLLNRIPIKELVS